MNQLRELIRQYVVGEIDFPAFPRAMVVGFLSSRNADEAVENAAAAIDVDCSYFSERLIDDGQLKRNIVLRLQPRQTAAVAGAVVFLAGYEFSTEFPNLRSPIPASGTFSSSSAQSAANVELAPETAAA